MKLKEGQIIKVVQKDHRSRVSERIGKIKKIYSNYILLDLKKYKECLGISDIIDPDKNRLKVKKNKQWIDANKDMLEVGIFK